MSSIRSRRRQAFTLIELLVVIGIIALLMSLTASAVYKFFGSQQTANTKTTLQTVQGKLMQQWKGVYDKAYKQSTIPSAYQANVQTMATYVSPTGAPDVNALERTRVIYAKLMQMQAFPMTLREAINGQTINAGTYTITVPPYGPYVQYLKDLGITTGSAVGSEQAWESSACLLMALQKGPQNTGVKAEDFGPAIGYAKHQGSDIPYLKDGWANPIFFCRWPFNNTHVNPGGAQTGSANDPSDVHGVLNATDWAKNKNAKTHPGFHYFNLHIHPLATRPTANSPAMTYVLTPVLISAGPDGKLGVSLRSGAGAQGGGLITTAGDDSDNIYSSDLK